MSSRKCPLCNEMMVPMRLQDPNNVKSYIYGWKCSCDASMRPDFIPQLTVRKKDD